MLKQDPEEAISILTQVLISEEPLSEQDVQNVMKEINLLQEVLLHDSEKHISAYRSTQ